jgi:citrate synthase
MVNRRLTSAEAAAILGIKRATLYAYVSRGVLRSERRAGGSTFDAHEVARLARTGRRATRSDAGVGAARRAGMTHDPVFVTELTLIEGGRLYYRGYDAVELSRTRSFEEVAEWLWAGAWPSPGTRWDPPSGTSRPGASVSLPGAVTPLERLMVAVLGAALEDDMRHDLSPGSVPAVGRRLIPTLVQALPHVRRARSGASPPCVAAGWPISGQLWQRLSRLPRTTARQAVLEAALVLAADHELAPSTLAVRVAAALRADPYVAVLTGLGPASGSWHSGSSGAPTEVERLLEDARRWGPERALGERLRRTGSTPHGFGMPLYPDGDPRGRELLQRIGEMGGPADRLEILHRVLDMAGARGFPPPNVDMGLGAVAFCGDMMAGAGQAISTLAKVSGWLAHTMEEYADPTRFRSRADYVGARPQELPRVRSA